MRDSGWRITWDPAGETPRVLLDFGDPMDGEIQRDLVQVVDVGRFDQAMQGRPFGRKNRKRRLEFNRLVEFSDGAEAFLAMLDAAADDPWGEKQLARIEPILGGSVFARAALLSFERDFVTQPFPGYSEKYAFRVDSGLTLVGDVLTIIGGWFNDPIEGGGTSSSGITIIVDSDTPDLVPGDVVYVDGVSGVAPGYYQVTNVNGGQVSLDAPTNNRPRIVAGGVTGGSSSGSVNLHYTATIYIDGMQDGATYQYSAPGVALAPITPGPFGRAEIALADISSQISYSNWYSGSGPPDASVDPLELNGQNQPKPGDVVAETGPTSWTVTLFRNGVEIDSQTVSPSWATSKAYSSGGPAIHNPDSGAHATFDLHGPGGGSSRRDPGVSQPITSGTAQKAV